MLDYYQEANTGIDRYWKVLPDGTEVLAPLSELQEVVHTDATLGGNGTLQKPLSVLLASAPTLLGVQHAMSLNLGITRTLTVSSPSGSFVSGHHLQGGSSGATALVVSTGTTSCLIFMTSPTPFQAGETITDTDNTETGTFVSNVIFAYNSQAINFPVAPAGSYYLVTDILFINTNGATPSAVNDVQFYDGQSRNGHKIATVTADAFVNLTGPLAYLNKDQHVGDGSQVILNYSGTCLNGNQLNMTLGVVPEAVSTCDVYVYGILINFN